MVILEKADFLSVVIKSSQYNLLGLDVGEKTIGVSVYSSICPVAVPITVIRRINMAKDVIQISSIVKEKDVTGVVIGLPLDLSGRISLNAEQMCQRIARAIEGRFPEIPITFYDERFTSKLANTVLMETDMKRVRRNFYDNAMAATFILSGFMMTHTKREGSSSS